MPAGKVLYRLLREDEDPSKGLSARNPEAKDAKISSHVNGLKVSPYISTTATIKGIRGFRWLAMTKNKKIQKPKKRKEPIVVKIYNLVGWLFWV